MRTRSTVVALLVIAAVAIWLVAFDREPPVPAPGLGTSRTVEPANPVVGAAEASETSTEREHVSSPEPTVDPAAFTSSLDDGPAETDPRRDGLVMFVRRESGDACANQRIVVHWRKGFGLYGSDRGATDDLGRFATTVPSVDQIEWIEFFERELGRMTASDDLLTSAGSDRVVEFIVPNLVPLHVDVRDLENQPIEGANVSASLRAGDLPPRQYRLHPEGIDALTDAMGRAMIRVPTGVGSVTAEKPDYVALTMPAISVQAATATTVFMISPNRHEVAISVALPPNTGPITNVAAFARWLPHTLADRLGVERETEYRRFEVREDVSGYTASVDRLPWRLVVYATGCETAVVDLLGHETAVQVAMKPAAPPPPKARIHVVVRDPDGDPISHAELRVHDTPDIVYGSNYYTDRNGEEWIDRNPDGTLVCVSARGSQGGVTYARGFSDPFELSEGDHEVILTLQPAESLRGRVVDENGEPVEANVKIRRPSGPLRQLGDGVGEILDQAPTQDWKGTALDGTFEFHDLYPGRHELWATPTAGGGVPGVSFGRPGDDVTVVLGRGLENYAILEIRITDAVTDEPLPETRITHIDGWTDADGEFRTALRPQTLMFWVMARDHVVTQWGPQHVAPGVHPIPIALERSPAVFVRVVDAEGRALENASVSAASESGEPRELIDVGGRPDGTSARTDASGRTELRGLPTGTLILIVEHGGEEQRFAMPAEAGRDSVFEVRWPE